jgi:hypothetical protein
VKIADLDFETRAVIVAAHMLVSHPSNKSFRFLREKLRAYDSKHMEERSQNLAEVLFGEQGIFKESDD